MGPLAQSDGHDAPWLFDELVPGEAAVVDDIVVGFEDAVREPVVAHELMGWTHENGMNDDDLRKAVEEVVLKLPDLLRADLSSRDPIVRKGAEEIVSARIIMALEAMRADQ